MKRITLEQSLSNKIDYSWAFLDRMITVVYYFKNNNHKNKIQMKNFK